MAERHLDELDCVAQAMKSKRSTRHSFHSDLNVCAQSEFPGRDLSSGSHVFRTSFNSDFLFQRLMAEPVSSQSFYIDVLLNAITLTLLEQEMEFSNDALQAAP